MHVGAGGPFQARGKRGFDDRRHRRFGKRGLGRPGDDRLVMVIVVIVMVVVVMVVVVMIMVAMIIVMMTVVMIIMGVVAPMIVVLVTFVLVSLIVMMPGELVVVGFGRMFSVVRMLLIGERGKLRHFGVLDDLAADAVVMAAAAGTAVARTPAAGTVLVLFLGLAMGTFVGLDQRLTVCDRDLVVVGMDFAEGEEAVAVAAIFDKGRLQRRFYPRDLGEVDVAAQLLALGGLEIKLFDAIAADHDNPGFFRVGGID